MPLKSINEDLHEEIEQETTARLDSIREEVLDRYVAATGKSRYLQSLHGTIGGKNNTYVDSIQTQFLDFKDFLARWLHGLLADARARNCISLAEYGRTYQNSSAHRIIRLLQDDLIREYTFLFLERNFYRNLLERTRVKPDSALWQLWFGDNKMT